MMAIGFGLLAVAWLAAWLGVDRNKLALGFAAIIGYLLVVASVATWMWRVMP